MEKTMELERQLKRLKLPGLWHALDLRLAEAREGKLAHLDFLALLIQDELTSREDSMFGKRLKAAGFGVEKTFADFDYWSCPDLEDMSELRKERKTCHGPDQPIRES